MKRLGVLCAVAALVVAAIVVLKAQQTTRLESLAVVSIASDALRVAGGATLGIDLHPQYGGVADRTVVMVNATTCPSPLILFPSSLVGLGTLITCVYIESAAGSQLGSALLGTSTLQ